MHSLLGGDLSINGSGFTLFQCDDELTVKNVVYVGFTKVKKKETHSENLHIILLDKDYSDKPYHARGKIIINAVSKYIDFKSVDYCAVEDYSFGSTGNTFDIAEVLGGIKEELYLLDIPYKKISPSSIKQFATGKGNADKLFMGIAYNKLGISTLSELKDFESPKADLVDSYWIAELLRVELFHKKYGRMPEEYLDHIHRIDAVLGGHSKKKTEPTISIPFIKRSY